MHLFSTSISMFFDYKTVFLFSYGQSVSCLPVSLFKFCEVINLPHDPEI